MEHARGTLAGLWLFGMLAGLALLPCRVTADEPSGPPLPREPESGHRGHRGRAQGPDRGLPPEVRARQSEALVTIPSLEDAIGEALAAADAAARSLLEASHHTGRRLRVPADHPTIQQAIDAAEPKDIVVVSAGTYYELLRMKDGVKLVSDDAEGGSDLIEVDGARVRLPRRTLRTIVDGSRSKPSRHGLIDFEPGTGRHAVVDGLTLQNLPRQDHHQPGHAHAVNVRGASAVIMHCLVQKNGSTGIGNHVVYGDQGQPIVDRDFRVANVKHPAEAVIYRNIVRGSLGRGIGCNHLSAPFILGNEIYGNDDSELGDPGPGVGAKHGARPRVIGNVVHDNPGGGIASRVGEPQGKHPIDRATAPTVRANVVYGNGATRPAISNEGGGATDHPVVFSDNVIRQSGSAGLGLSRGAVGVIEGNRVTGCRMAAIAVNGATLLRLNGNRIADTSSAGIAIVGGAKVLEMKDNAVQGTGGPPYVVGDADFR